MGHRSHLRWTSATALALLTLISLAVLGANAPHKAITSPNQSFQRPAAGPELSIWPPPTMSCILKLNETKVYHVELRNPGDAPLEISRIGDDYAGDGPPSWLTLGNAGPLTVPALDSIDFSFSIFGDPSIAGSDVIYDTKIYFLTNAAPPDDSVTYSLSVMVSQFPGPTIDTLITSSISQVVNLAGNMGNSGVGHVNMNFAPPVECDTGSNSRGNAAIYLFEASPLVVRDPAVAGLSAWYSMYQTQGFTPVVGGPATYDSQTVHYQKYYGGEALTGDNLVRISNTWWVPKQFTPDNFVIHRMQLWPAANGSSVPNLAIGEVFDWDIPTDSNAGNNVGGYDASSRNMVWLRGFNSVDGVADCQDNSYRYGGAAVIGIHLESQKQDTLLHGAPFGGFTMVVESLLTGVATNFSQTKLWNAMKIPGYAVDPQIVDQLSMLVFKNGVGGYTLPANDTLTVFTVLASVRTAASSAAGLDSLKKAIDVGKNFCSTYIKAVRGPSCCQGRRGNVNMAGIVDLSDLAALVSFLTGGAFVLPCLPAADINGDGVINLADLSCLIAQLTGGFCESPVCPQ